MKFKIMQQSTPVYSKRMPDGSDSEEKYCLTWHVNVSFIQ